MVRVTVQDGVDVTTGCGGSEAPGHQVHHEGREKVMGGGEGVACAGLSGVVAVGGER